MPEGGEPYLNHLLLDVSSIFENIMISKQVITVLDHAETEKKGIHFIVTTP
jgi:hypothetical protein